MNTHRILYIMNVDWNWIKQRPHYIAEELSEFYTVKIAYRYRYDRTKLQNREIKSKNLIPIYLVPKISNINGLMWINTMIFKLKILWIIKKYKIDILYVTYPDQVKFIPYFFKGKIIYDCMDNHTAFINDLKKKNKLEVEEKNLIEKSDCVLISSKYLLSEIQNKYNTNDKLLRLVRNAYNGEVLLTSSIKKNLSVFKMAYIGTLSSWFDWETIINVVKQRNDAEVHLFGPLEKTSIPNTNQIIYHGTVDHDELYEVIKEMDALIMPFKVNDIIKAVDPVKIYEYINFDKDIVMCRYDEVLRFENYVYFYSSVDEFIKAIDLITHSKKVKYSNKDRLEFLENNQWSKRAAQIVEIIEEFN